MKAKNNHRKTFTTTNETWIDKMAAEVTALYKSVCEEKGVPVDSNNDEVKKEFEKRLSSIVGKFQDQ